MKMTGYIIKRLVIGLYLFEMNVKKDKGLVLFYSYFLKHPNFGGFLVWNKIQTQSSSSNSTTHIQFI